MKITNEQIQAILDGAPDGATHCTDTVPSMNLYAKVEHLGGFYVSLSNRWESYPIYAGMHLLSDLREILELRQEVERLKESIESAVGNMEYAAFNLLGETELRPKYGERIIESTCPEKSLLIAIRDLKEAREQSDE